MDLLKNKASGKYFIQLEDPADSAALFITPSGELKALELRLFESPGIDQGVESMGEDLLLRLGLVTQDQIKRYHKYVGTL